jgi:hypothetical protein
MAFDITIAGFCVTYQHSTAASRSLVSRTFLPLSHWMVRSDTTRQKTGLLLTPQVVTLHALTIVASHSQVAQSATGRVRKHWRRTGIPRHVARRAAVRSARLGTCARRHRRCPPVPAVSTPISPPRRRDTWTVSWKTRHPEPGATDPFPHENQQGWCEAQGTGVTIT